MTWPNGSDYIEAIQNPQENLHDERLRRGSVVLLPLGIPKVVSGNFASVFEMQEAGRKWAVKCFTRHVKDLQERYIAISEHLKAHQLSSMVNFEYQLQGIRVNGVWRPILCMQWVEGPLLDEFVHLNRNNRQTLLNLAAKWIDCVSALSAANIAHGDLQFGNIKVVGSEIKLFDYDGMYVPSLQTRGSSENGHPNFQHPKRPFADFDLSIDHFPAWVIYVSLVAVAEHPTIWSEAEGGDDCLIFRKRDFDAPSSSRLFATLERVGSPELRADLARLKDFAQRPPSQVPSLQSVKRFRSEVRPPPKSARGTPDWAAPNLPGKAPSKPAAEIIELVRSTAAAELFYSRLVFAAAIALWLALGYLGGPTWITVALILVAPLLALISGVIVFVLYEHFSSRVAVSPEVARRRLASLDDDLRAINSERRSLRENLRHSDEAIQSVLRTRESFEEQTSKDRDEWESRRKDLQRRHEAELAHLDQTSSVRNSPAPELLVRRAKLVTDLGCLESKRAAQLASLRRDALKPFVVRHLQAHAITSVSIPGLGEYGISRLKEEDFHTALDILSGRSLQLFGLGQRERLGLTAWAERLRQEAEDDAIRNLASDQMDPVNTYWDAQGVTLQNELTALDALITDSERSRREMFAAERQDRLWRFQLELQKHDHSFLEWNRDTDLRRLELEKSLQDTRKNRTAELMDAAAQRSKIDEREKALESGKKACLVGQELKATLSFWHFLASLLPKRP